MLVLQRQLDESIMIGDDVVITVVEIKGDRVRLGIAAPRSIAVHRQEVYEGMQRENMEAAFTARQVDSTDATSIPALPLDPARLSQIFPNEPPK